ncbi:MAG: hypothetical protein ABLT11_11085 [Candidatus Acidiferrum sp.]
MIKFSSDAQRHTSRLSSSIKHYISKFATRRRRSFFPGHAAADQLVSPLFEMLLNFRGEIAVYPAARKQSFQPTHDFT